MIKFEKVVKTFIVLFISIALIIQCGKKKEDKDKTIVNTPPKINEVTLLPLNPTIQSEITARILSSDKEGDPITYKVKWFVNGQEIGEGMFFKHEEIKKGDEVYAEITPFDGKEWGKPVKTDEITIGGLPPKILAVKIAP